MIPLWLVVWTTFKCPFWLPSAAPQELKPILCKSVDHAEDFGPWALAADRLQQVGPDAKPRLFRINGDKFEPVPVKFKHLLEITEE